MPIRKCKVYITFYIVLLLFCPGKTAVGENLHQETFAKNEPPSGRPKIGLVLSGGGARGFAHIGVLKVLEENRVPVDFIVGTSMGSIIGGLYAIGLSPEEIEQGVQSIAWDKVFKDFAYRNFKTFRRKKDDFDFFNIHRVGIVSDGLQLSPGLIEGQQIELALDRLAHPGFHIDNYDGLRIPYRAVATDIETGKPFVISNGNIGRAMRASMSIPGALPPITINNSLLVDGGIANNIPINIARDMGADIIIVVDVSAPLSGKESIRSSVDVTAQLTTIMTRRIADVQLKTLRDYDILIVPGSKEISSSDFGKHAELIKAGIAATEKKHNAVQRLSLSAEAYSAYHAALPDVANRSPTIDFIEIHNETTLADDIIKVRIHQKIGEPLDVAQLEDDISYIYGLDFSSSVVYSLETRQGKTGLIIYARSREWASSYLQFGLSIQSETDIGSLTDFSASYTKQDLNSLAGEFRAVAGLGSQPELSAEIYQPLNVNLDLFVAAKTGVKTTIFPNIDNDNVESIERFQRIYLDLSAGKIFKQNTQLSLGLGFADGNTSTISGNSLYSDGDFKEGFVYTRLIHDSLDNLSFPNSGVFAGIGLRSNQENLGADSDYQQLEFTISGAGTYKRYTLFSRAIIETSINEDAPFNAVYRHGGFLEVSGSQRRELAGQHFGLVEAAFYRRLGNISFLPIYSGFSVEAGNAWDRYEDISTANTTLAGSIFIGADTFVGPLYLSFGVNDGGQQALYFNLGQSFLAR